MSHFDDEQDTTSATSMHHPIFEEDILSSQCSSREIKGQDYNGTLHSCMIHILICIARKLIMVLPKIKLVHDGKCTSNKLRNFSGKPFHIRSLHRQLSNSVEYDFRFTV